MAQSDKERLERFRQILDFDYFILKPRDEQPCKAHPETSGTIFPVTRNLTLLNSWLSRECSCFIYGVSKVRLGLLLEKGEIWREVETDPQ
jgi:hypothetical protein